MCVKLHDFQVSKKVWLQNGEITAASWESDFFPLCNNNVRAAITFGPGSGLEVFLRREVLPAPCLFQELHSHVLAGNLSGNHIPFPVPIQQRDPSQPERLADRFISRAWERNVTTRGQKCWHFESCPMPPFRRNLFPPAQPKPLPYETVFYILKHVQKDLQSLIFQSVV